jgi:hypothetical protein
MHPGGIFAALVVLSRIAMAASACRTQSRFHYMSYVIGPVGLAIGSIPLSPDIRPSRSSCRTWFACSSSIRRLTSGLTDRWRSIPMCMGRTRVSRRHAAEIGARALAVRIDVTRRSSCGNRRLSRRRSRSPTARSGRSPAALPLPIPLYAPAAPQLASCRNAGSHRTGAAAARRSSG